MRLPLILRGAWHLLECALAAMWLVSAAAKLLSPLPAYELIAADVGGGGTAHATFAAIVGAEVLLGALMSLRVVRGLYASLGLLLVFTTALLRVRSVWGGTFACGCFGDTATIDDALLRNGILAGVVAAMILARWTYGIRRRTSQVP